MKARVAAVVLIGAILGVAWWRCSDRDRAGAPAPPARAGAAAHGGDDDRARTPADPAAAIDGRGGDAKRGGVLIRRLSPADRAELATRIAAAQRDRAHHEETAPSPAIPDQVRELDLEHAPVDLRDALEEATRVLAACYDDEPDGGARHDAVVMMTLRGDPELGTLIDPDQLVDESGQPLAPSLSGCLKTTLESLELPPLEQGDELSIQYSFSFGAPDPNAHGAIP